MQEIARSLGYNLIVHGSLNRDFDLVAIPWVNEPATQLELVQELDMYLTGKKHKNEHQYMHSMLPGGRSSYVINLNRGGFTRDDKILPDEQYYLDISITPLIFVSF